MKFNFIVILLLSTISYSQKGNTVMKKGSWNASLQLNPIDYLPFNIKVKNNNTLIVVNANEEIQLEPALLKNDSLHYRFPYFNSELVLKNGKKKMYGYWVNHTKGSSYKIPFKAEKGRKKRFSHLVKSKKRSCFKGKWKVEFEPGTSSSYPAIGLFKQKRNHITGTFLTETGDYRYLDGNTTEDSLFLSCFDGSHAFLFKANLLNDSLIGKFYSGNHWQSTWGASRNNGFELTNPETLTSLSKNKKIEFKFPNLNKDSIAFPDENYNGKVVIIQIMGTWCPNCLDESVYYKELEEKYGDKGLEIISVCYESGSSIDSQISNVKRLQAKLQNNFTYLIGGSAKKNLASKHFSMLSEIISFPTSIFINKQGDVVRIHTGFNGPGTGEYYKKHKERTSALLESLLID